MDWGSIVGIGLIIGLAAIALQLLWRLLHLLVVLGPLTYVALVAGFFISKLTHHTIVGALVAIVVAGLLGERLARFRLGSTDRLIIVSR